MTAALSPSRPAPLDPAHASAHGRPPRRPAAAGVALRTLLALAGTAPALLAAPPPAVAGPTDDARELGERAVALLSQAERAGDPARARDAAEMLARAIRLDPEEPQWPFVRTLAFVLAKDADGAKASLDALVEVLGPQAARDPRPLYARALLHATLGSNVAEALRLLEELKERNPAFMRDAVKSVEFQSRIAFASQLIHARPAADNLRQAYLQEAIRQARAALALVRGESRELLARRNLAQVYRAADQWPESEAEWRQLAEREPRSAIVRYSLASVLADQHNYGEALAEWERCLELLGQAGTLDPREADSVADARMRYGVCLDHVGRKPDALVALRAYTTAVPGDSRGWFYLGRTLAEADEDPDPKVAAATLSAAIGALEEARRLDPWCAGPLHALRQIYHLRRPDPEKRKALEAELEDPARQKARKAEMDRRKGSRPDGTNGCE